MPHIKLCSLRSSSKGNSSIVFDNETKILVDCGISGKELSASLEKIGIAPEEIDAIIITHEHSDHTKGVGIVSRKYDIPIYANERTWKAMMPSLGKVKEENIRVFGDLGCFSVGKIHIEAFSIPHDAAQPVGFVFEKNGEKVAVATDMGTMTKEVFEKIKGSRVVLLESNYDLLMLEAGTYPYDLKCRIKGSLGHLCNEDAALVARDLVCSGTKEIILGHISQDNNYPDLVFETTKLCLLSHGIKVGQDVNLTVAKRDDVTNCNI